MSGPTVGGEGSYRGICRLAVLIRTRRFTVGCSKGNMVVIVIVIKVVIVVVLEK